MLKRKERIRWKNGNSNVYKKIKAIKDNGTNVPQEIIAEIDYVLDEIDNTYDRNSIYMSSWLSKRLAMECHSEKVMQYKNFLATLDVREVQLID